MTILLYDHIELQERPSRHLKVWKGCHLVLYSLAAVSGILNFVFLQNAMELIDENCVLFPRKLEFTMMELPAQNSDNTTRLDVIDSLNDIVTDADNTGSSDTTTKNDDTTESSTSATGRRKRDTPSTDDDVALNNGTQDGNATAITGNSTHRQVLDTSRTLFDNQSNDCQFAEFMPIMSTIFAAVWLTLFTMCPGGGHARTGLQQPWRILMPALLFSLVMVGLTGHSFTTTNKGIHAFCEAFSDLTNSTTCSAADPFIALGWNASWTFSGRVSAARGASAGGWAAWACAATLLLVRCLTAPDFVVKRTGVFLTKDPQQKIIPHLRIKSPRSRSSQSSPTKRDTVSVKSEPTAVTELVSASVEPGHESAPSSLTTTPIRMPRNSDVIEMTYNPQERFLGP